MIYGIGVDMVQISRIQSALTRFGDSFARRILTDREFDGFARARCKATFLAKHFAAKEAMAKALGTGFQGGLHWRHMEVRHDPLGKPYLTTSGRAQELWEAYRIGASHLSLSDEREYALAFVTLLQTSP